MKGQVHNQRNNSSDSQQRKNDREKTTEMYSRVILREVLDKLNIEKRGAIDNNYGRQ